MKILSNVCDETTAVNQTMGQIDGPRDSAASAIKMAMNMRECQFFIRIKYIAR
jgi:hypothetical protein